MWHIRFLSSQVTSWLCNALNTHSRTTTKMVHWTISCICVMWFCPCPAPFRRLASLSPFIPMNKHYIDVHIWGIFSQQTPSVKCDRSHVGAWNYVSFHTISVARNAVSLLRSTVFHVGILGSCWTFQVRQFPPACFSGAWWNFSFSSFFSFHPSDSIPGLRDLGSWFTVGMIPFLAQLG